MTSTPEAKKDDPDIYLKDVHQEIGYDNLMRLLKELPPKKGANPNVAYRELIELLGLTLITECSYKDIKEAPDPKQGYLEAWDPSWLFPQVPFPDREERGWLYTVTSTAIGGLENPGHIAVIATSRYDARRKILAEAMFNYLPWQKGHWFDGKDRSELNEFMNKLYVDLENVERQQEVAFLISDT